MNIFILFFLLCSIAVGNVAASSPVRNINIPRDCSATHSSPPNSTLSLQGNNYFLLPGLQFGNPSCQPSITCFEISGKGNFTIGLLQMAKNGTSHGHYSYRLKRSFYAPLGEYLFNIPPPFQLDERNNVTVVLAAFCKPEHGSRSLCVSRDISEICSIFRLTMGEHCDKWEFVT